MNVLGIDPGISGALALLSPDKKILELFDIPTLTNKVIKGKAKKVINYKALQQLLYVMVAEHGEMVCYIENVHSMPGQSVVAMFNMGETLGAIKAIVACEGIEINYVAPQTWKKHLKIPMGAHLSATDKKELSRCKTIQLYPNNLEFFSRKLDHNRAEATLIARYGVETRL